jgi:uroporphyrinogen III methyltransferase/synthase
LRTAIERPSRILLPRSDLAPRTLPDGLRRQGHEVHAVVAYRTVPGPRPEDSVRRAARAADAALFFSPSAVRQFGRLGLRAPRAVVACIGPTTAAAARRGGLRSPAVPAEPTPRALLATLEQAFAPRGHR